jgi:hypothetical protein
MLARSAYRESLQQVDVTDFDNVLNAWLVHGVLPGRLVRPVALMRDALVEKLASDSAMPSIADSTT